MHLKKIEKGYTLLFILMALLIVTVLDAVITQHIIVAKNIALAYAGMMPMSVDMSVYNWIIGAESAALALAIPAQYKKKAKNNTDEYLQKWINDLAKDPAHAPYMQNIIIAYLQSANINN